MSFITERRFGWFALSIKRVEDNEELIYKLMSMCIITRAEYMLENDVMLYTASSPAFKRIPKGARAPKYRVCISEAGEVSFEEEAPK